MTVPWEVAHGTRSGIGQADRRSASFAWLGACGELTGDLRQDWPMQWVAEASARTCFTRRSDHTFGDAAAELETALDRTLRCSA